MTSPTVVEGFADFSYPAAGKPLQTYYKITGDLTSTTATPLIVLHGGPGVGLVAYDILSDLTAQHGIPLVQYDQVGCRRSTHMQEKADAGAAFWTEDLYIAELHNLIAHLKLDTYDVVGHSWGAMFGSTFAARRPKGLRRYVAWSSAPASKIWVDAQAKLRATLPEEVQEVIERCEREGKTDSEEYGEAMGQYYARYMCRLDPWPKDVEEGLAELSKDPTVYSAMWGPSEWLATGTLKDWSTLDNLANIDVPVLLVNGRYDEAQDSCMAPFFEHIPKVKWVQLAESAHMAHFEERERFMQVVGGFLTA